MEWRFIPYNKYHTQLFNSRIIIHNGVQHDASKRKFTANDTCSPIIVPKVKNTGSM